MISAADSRRHYADKSSEASAIVIYGRRRVGKTELIEQLFRGLNIIKADRSINYPFIDHSTPEAIRHASHQSNITARTTICS